MLKPSQSFVLVLQFCDANSKFALLDLHITVSVEMQNQIFKGCLILCAPLALPLGRGAGGEGHSHYAEKQRNIKSKQLFWRL